MTKVLKSDFSLNLKLLRSIGQEATSVPIRLNAAMSSYEYDAKYNNNPKVRDIWAKTESGLEGTILRFLVLLDVEHGDN